MRRALPVLSLLAALHGCDAVAQEGATAPEATRNDPGRQLDQRMREEARMLRQGALFSDSGAATERSAPESFLQRLPGRFRIAGLIEDSSSLNKPTGKITGVADCSAVGAGLGVHCIINATWPVIDPEVAAIGASESPAEMINTFRPGVLVLGVAPGSEQVRSLLVTADSISHALAGTLDGDTLWAGRVGECTGVRCLRRLRFTAGPDGEVVTMLLHYSSIDITITMHRDPQARAASKLRSLKAH